MSNQISVAQSEKGNRVAFLRKLKVSNVVIVVVVVVVLSVV